MLTQFFKLKEQPFGVTPDPRYLFLTPTHREAFASIMYGVMENRGFTALVAPPGMGKTTLLFDFLARCEASMRTVFLFQFQPSPEGLLRNLLSELGVPDEDSSFESMQEKLNQVILQESKNGKRIVVVVDEAQNFGEPVLEVLRMLSNFETSQEKLLHIILSGQPQLADLLFSPSIEQLRQRISIMAVLRPLDASETRQYIEHRLRVAGYQSTRPLFSNGACERIAKYSEGVPRNINNLCFNAMSLGCALKRLTIGPEIVEEVFRDLRLAEEPVAAAPIKTATPSLRTPLHLPEVSAWPPMPAAPPPGSGLRAAAGIASFAAVLAVGGILARQYVISPSNQPNVSIAVPAPPAPQVEVLPPAPTAQDPVEEPPLSEPQAVPQPVAAKVLPTDSRTPVRRQTTDSISVRVKLVRISQRQTLYELCKRNVDACDANAIREIQRLNPWLHDSKQLEVGQAVRVPLEASSKRYKYQSNSGEKQ